LNCTCQQNQPNVSKTVDCRAQNVVTEKITAHRSSGRHVHYRGLYVGLAL
jgi:hypothetical protein